MKRAIDAPPGARPSLVEGMTRDRMEKRRLDAAAALRSGETPAQVARRFYVTRTTSSRWARILASCGEEGLARGKASGRPISVRRSLIGNLIRQRRGGWLAERNVGKALAAAIKNSFGVQYSEDHALRIARLVAPDLFPPLRTELTAPNQRTPEAGAASNKEGE